MDCGTEHKMLFGTGPVSSEPFAWPASRRLDLPTSPCQADAQIQSGVLAYRHDEKGKPQILLIRKNTSRNWGIPKGKLEPGLTLEQNASKEAFEEAGVSGRIAKPPIGSFRAMKWAAGQRILIDVTVFLLEVTAAADVWPEMHIRALRWCTPAEAAMCLRQPLLASACGELNALAHSWGRV